MTRINVVPVEELTQQHLVAEYRELPRIYGAVRKSQQSGKTPSSFKNMPSVYRLGSGHVTFFYNKLAFIMRRHQQLIDEMLRRGYNPSFTDDPATLTGDLDACWFEDYIVTDDALFINRERIALRIAESEAKKLAKKKIAA